jgi:hypothetical protein
MISLEVGGGGVWSRPTRPFNSLKRANARSKLCLGASKNRFLVRCRQGGEAASSCATRLRRDEPGSQSSRVLEGFG